MILVEARVRSFGGLADCTVAFSPGLNVLLGPNEAGKSTLFQALLHCLLTPAGLSKPQFQSLLSGFVPVGGGDTLASEVVFRVGEHRYRLAKSWGATRQAELALPDGSRITDERELEEKLRELLPAPAGTLRCVLAASQARLSATIDELQAERETLQGLSDLLRRSVLATDGVSVARFREAVRLRLERLLDHWDLERQRPEGGKGLENRWKRKVGEVLEAFYQAEELRRERDGVLARERQLEELAGQLQACLAELAAAEAGVQGEQTAARDAGERRPLEAELAAAQAALRSAQGDYESWTRLSVQLESLRQEGLELQQRAESLEAELSAAEARESAARLAERVQRVRARQAALERAQATLEALPALSRAAVEQIRQAATQLARAQAAGQAGGLRINLQARQELTVRVQADDAAPVERRLGPAESLEVQAAGRLLLEHPDWRMEVRSGEGSGQDAGQAADELGRLLAAHALGSLREAEERVLARERAEAELTAAQRLLQEELGTDTRDALEAQLAALAASATGTGTSPAAGRPTGALPAVDSPRSVGHLAEERGRLRGRLQQAANELRGAQRAVEGLTARWGSPEKLLAQVAELTGACRKRELSLAALAPLPAGFSDASAFLEHHAGLQARAAELREKRAALEAQFRAAERNLGEESSEEASARLQEASARLEGRLAAAAILRRVQQSAEAILASTEEGVEEPLRRRFADHLSALTGGRYREVAPGAETAVPQALLRPDGRPLPYALLSAGTRDLFALALRLSMAELFLGERGGFLIMDDPLVALDPERQRQAAAALAGFAGRRQVLLFTCQPSHAALFDAAAVRPLQLYRPPDR